MTASGGPVGKAHGFIVDRDVVSGAFISILFGVSAPSDIARLVVSVVVNTVKGIRAVRAMTDFGDYVVDEHRAVVPRGIIRDTSSAVVFEGLCFGVVAAPAKVSPQVIEVVSATYYRINRCAVCGINLSRNFSCVATTGLRIAGNH